MDKKRLTNMINEENCVGYLATDDKGTPRVRPISAKYTLEKLMFSTYSGSNKMKQIKNNNHAEMTWMFPDMSHLRIEATINEIQEPETKRAYLEAWPFIKQFFKDENDPNYTLLELQPKRAYFMAMGDMTYTDVVW